VLQEGTTNMGSLTMKSVAAGQESNEKDTEQLLNMGGGRLEASEHTDSMQEEGPGKHQQLQQQLKAKLHSKHSLNCRSHTNKSHHQHQHDSGEQSHPDPSV
jgi:hypothetical protein